MTRDSARKYAEDAQRELGRASHVTKQTLAFARRSEERTPQNLGDIADRVLDLFEKRLAAKSITVARKYRGNVGAEVSANEVEQVISNVLTNALDAMSSGGRLHVRTTRAHWAQTPRIRLTIADTGMGIAAEHQRHVFTPFFSTKTNTGTGLGLWVTKQIIEAHGGCIHVRSRAGRGTVVVLCWPIHARVIVETGSSV